MSPYPTEAINARSRSVCRPLTVRAVTTALFSSCHRSGEAFAYASARSATATTSCRNAAMRTLKSVRMSLPSTSDRPESVAEAVECLRRGGQGGVHLDGVDLLRRWR